MRMRGNNPTASRAGTSFSHEERRDLHLMGTIPPAYESLQQVSSSIALLYHCASC